jgi:hypothetical protein
MVILFKAEANPNAAGGPEHLGNMVCQAEPGSSRVFLDVSLYKRMKISYKTIAAFLISSTRTLCRHSIYGPLAVPWLWEELVKPSFGIVKDGRAGLLAVLGSLAFRHSFRSQPTLYIYRQKKPLCRQLYRNLLHSSCHGNLHLPLRGPLHLHLSSALKPNLRPRLQQAITFTCGRRPQIA